MDKHSTKLIPIQFTQSVSEYQLLKFISTSVTQQKLLLF